MDFLFAVEWKFLWSLLLIISFKCNGTLSDLGKMSSPQNHFGSSAQSQFATRNSTRVIAQKGGLAILPCVVKLNSPATVSWIRRRDFQLLTVGLSTHSSDKRFLVEHTRHMGHWSLRIKSVREEDRGFYECQLSIYPTQSIFIELKVVEAVAEITGAPDLHIDEGSTLRLECKLKRATENPAFVFWYHDSKMVNYDAQDGFSVSSTIANSPFALDTGSNALGSANTNSLLTLGETIPTLGYELGQQSQQQQQQPQIRDRAGGSLQQQQQSQQQLQQMTAHQSYLLTPSTSLLTIQEVHFHHAGNYTCAPSNARPASITVHVLRGEKPAAMQHANRSNIFDNSNNNDGANGAGGSGNKNNNNNNNNHSTGAIGASTSGAMAQFAQNSLILMAFTSLYVALWQLSKLLSMSSTQQQQQQQQQRREKQQHRENNQQEQQLLHQQIKDNDEQEETFVPPENLRRTKTIAKRKPTSSTMATVAPSLKLCCCCCCCCGCSRSSSSRSNSHSSNNCCCHGSRHAKLSLSLSLLQVFQQLLWQNVQQQQYHQQQQEQHVDVTLMYFYHKIER